MAKRDTNYKRVNEIRTVQKQYAQGRTTGRSTLDLEESLLK